MREAGHNIRVLGSEDFEGMVAAAGLEFRSSGPNIQALTESDEWRQLLGRGNFLAILRQMRIEVKKHAAIVAERLPQLLQGYDLIVTGMSGMGGVYAIAEQLATPVVEAYVVPFYAHGRFS